jgi:hypothetical protein
MWDTRFAGMDSSRYFDYWNGVVRHCGHFTGLVAAVTKSRGPEKGYLTDASGNLYKQKALCIGVILYRTSFFNVKTSSML